MTDHLLETIDGGVATLTMNQPNKLNAMSTPMMDALKEAVPRLAEDPSVGVVVLTGSGRGFCSGGDIGDMTPEERGQQTYEERWRQLRGWMEASRGLHEMPKPTIAMIRGAAAGAGLSMALACDLRIASETLKMTTAFVRVGLSGDFGGSYYMTRLVGGAKARELYFTADMIDAETALALGLVNRVVDDDALERETDALAKRLADGPRVTLAYMKRNLNAAETGTLSDVMDLEAMHHARTGMTEDHVEAAAAFREKRAPNFKGR